MLDVCTDVCACVRLVLFHVSVNADHVTAKFASLAFFDGIGRFVRMQGLYMLSQNRGDVAAFVPLCAIYGGDALVD